MLAEVLRSVAGGPTLAFGWTKRALAAATLTELESVQAIEAEGQLALVDTADFRKARAPSGSGARRIFAVTEQRRADVTIQKVRVDGLDIEYTDTGHGADDPVRARRLRDRRHLE